MGLTVAYKGGVRFDVASGVHTVITDQPVEDGGHDDGMSPVDLFVGSIASCVAYFVGRYCERHQIPAEGLRVEADWSMAERPHRVGTVSMKITLPATITPEQRERLLKVAHGCTVHQSLAVPPKVAIEMTSDAVSRPESR